MTQKQLMMGNQAIARGLVENGCAMATSYPGTPASEILAFIAKEKTSHDLPMHVQWAINEKVAFEIAYAGAISGLRSAVSMKQVGLNVASDPLMSAAYMGTKGGFIVISADDPGPHSSQTEQDSRLMAKMAKIPVLDPDSPLQAKEMTAIGFELSEAFKIPVMLRPTTRVCHSRQDITPGTLEKKNSQPDFEKNPGRWAATPKFRFQLHGELEEKLEKIAAFEKTAPFQFNPMAQNKKAVVVSGVAAAHAKEIMKDLGLLDVLPLYQVLQPYPLHTAFIDTLLKEHDEILVIEETTDVIESQLCDRIKVKGKLDQTVSRVGELLPEKIESIILQFMGKAAETARLPQVPGRRPTLCAGCPHRASFFAIKKAAPKGIYTSDIGCYTLGLNLGAVDTVLCMGAALGQGAGFYHAYKNEKKRPDIVATIGDSTFFHSGVPALIDAVVQNVKFVLVILDNRTTAMTGSQPTPATGKGACGEPTEKVDIKTLVKGCGVDFVKEGNPYEVKDFIGLVKEAVSYSREKGPAVIISKYPCLIDMARKGQTIHVVRAVEINESCDLCGYCLDHFECPALVGNKETESVEIDPVLCTGCGVCIDVCPKKSIQEVK